MSLSAPTWSANAPVAKTMTKMSASEKALPKIRFMLYTPF
jgi:hypothetical protein